MLATIDTLGTITVAERCEWRRPEFACVTSVLKHAPHTGKIVHATHQEHTNSNFGFGLARLR
jgi:hypothetical protein